LFRAALYHLSYLATFRDPLKSQTTKLVRFTPIVAGLPTGKQQNAERVRNAVDYNKARSSHGDRDGF
ncbi:MAG: hypothetical protein WA474_17005, partial [Candidatus Sulfotelmatobacter sp.]